MSQKLHIGEGFNLPKDVVTATTVVYGGKGMGKTNFGSVLVEELTKVNQRWAVLDPLGVWWGLRHSKDGKGPGIQCLILGGPHGDIPIEPTGGVVVADLVADEDVNVIVDFSRKPTGEAWGVAEKIRFVTEFGRRLFQRQSSLVNGKRREPLLVVMDEAARFVPQMVRSGETDLAKCLSVWAQIVEEGRNFGLGVVLLTQRSARLNKDVAELADAMLAFRTVGPNSIDAVTDWLGEHVDKAHIKQIIEQLRSLPRGSCLVVSPGWLQLESIVAVRMRETFDSSATPKPGESARRVTGAAAKPDLEKYAERMKETIEKAKAEDPAALRKRVAELERQLVLAARADAPSAQSKAAQSKVDITPKLERAAKAAVKSFAMQVRSQLTEARQKISAAARDFTKLEAELAAATQLCAARAGEAFLIAEDLQKLVSAEFIATAAALPPTQEPERRSSITLPPAVRVPAPPARRIEVTQKRERVISTLPVAISSNGHHELSGPEQNILDQLADLEALGIARPSKPQLSLMCGYTNFRSGGFSEPLAEMLKADLISYPAQGLVALTDAGRSLARPSDKPLGVEELHERLMQKLGGADAKILREIIAVYPDEVNKDELGLRCGYTNPRSGGFSEPIARLKALGIIESPQKSMVRCADWMFI